MEFQIDLYEEVQTASLLRLTEYLLYQHCGMFPCHYSRSDLQTFSKALLMDLLLAVQENYFQQWKDVATDLHIDIHQKSVRSGKEHKIETSLPTRAGNVPHRRSKDNVPPTQHNSLRESAKITN